MTTLEVQIAHYDAVGTLGLRELLMAMYLRCHLDQQHNPWYSPEQFWERLETLYAPSRNFGTVAGWLDGVMVGYAFGSTRERTQAIWNEVRAALPDVPVPESPEPVYIFREFAVDPLWQRHGAVYSMMRFSVVGQSAWRIYSCGPTTSPLDPPTSPGDGGGYMRRNHFLTLQ